MPPRDPFGLQGQIIDGQLRVDEAVGEGGFSVVYRGHHLGLNEPIAVKCLKLSTRLDPSLTDAFSMRFRDEGRLAYRLSQGNLHIVRSITSGTAISPTTGAFIPYMALEWLEGKSLAHDIFARAAIGDAYSVQQAVSLFEPAVQALEYAHSQGVIHRDIKPGNLYLAKTREGVRLKVLDFGLAKILHDENAVLGVTASVKTINNVLMCSPSYGAPEQFDGSIGPIGPWTDVYAFALVFIEALALKKARAAGSLTEGAIRALNPKAPPPTPRTVGVEVGDAIEAVLARALSMAPSDRHQSAAEFWKDLREAMLVPGAPTSMALTIRDDMLPRMARVLAEPSAAPMPPPAPAPAPAPPAPLSTPVAFMPGQPASVPPAKAAAVKMLSSTMRMDESPALPWELMRAVEQAANRNRLAQTQLAPDPRSGSIPVAPPSGGYVGPGAFAATALPSTLPSMPPVPSMSSVPPAIPPRAGSRVPLIVALVAFALFVVSALTFAAAFYFRHRIH